MKNIFVLLVFALLYVGCDKSNPIESGNSASTSEVAFSEEAMLKTTIVTVLEVTPVQTDSTVHDSLKNVRMLNSLKIHVGLSDVQFDSVKVYGRKLFSTLLDIRKRVHAGTISRDSARTLVKTARDQFVISVKTILTASQVTLFDEWIVKFWNRKHGGRGGHGGHGGGHGMGGGPKGGRP